MAKDVSEIVSLNSDRFGAAPGESVSVSSHGLSEEPFPIVQNFP